MIQLTVILLSNAEIKNPAPHTTIHMVTFPLLQCSLHVEYSSTIKVRTQAHNGER